MADTSRPLLDDPAVKEFLALLEQHDAPGKGDFLTLLQQIAGMEQQLAAATAELAAMRRELAEVRDGPVKRVLTKATKSLEQSIFALRERLDALKESVRDGCRRAVAAFRERGASALAHTAAFFHIRPALEAVGRAADRAMDDCDRTAANIRNITATYHEAGRHLKNAGRVLAGREPVAENSGPGRLARAVESLCKREKALHGAVKRNAQRAAASLSRLEQAAQRKPSIRDTMRELNEKISREQRERPAPTAEHEGR